MIIVRRFICPWGLAVEIDENSADAWAHLSYLYQEEFIIFNPRPESLNRALHAGQRAIELDQSNIMGNFALAMTHFSRGDIEISLNQMDRALALNPGVSPRRCAPMA